MSHGLRDRAYIVTGASKGFGLAIARRLVEQGARVGIIGRNQEAVDDAVAQIGIEHTHGAACDVGSSEQVREVFAKLKSHFGRLDGSGQ